MYTMDFYFTNKLPSNIAVQPQGENNNTPNADWVEAADPIFFYADPLQPGEVCLHPWMLYTPQSPILDLTGEHIRLKKILKQHSTPLIYVHKRRNNRSLMAENKEEPVSQSKSLSDSDSSDDNEVNPQRKMSVEERQYNTIPGLAIATHIALSYSRAQANPTIERGPPHQKVKVNKPSTQKTG